MSRICCTFAADFKINEVMTKENKEKVEGILYMSINALTGSNFKESKKIIKAIIDDVCKDIEETAENPAEFTSGDVNYSKLRVMKKRLGAEE